MFTRERNGRFGNFRAHSRGIDVGERAVFLVQFKIAAVHVLAIIVEYGVRREIRGKSKFPAFFHIDFIGSGKFQPFHFEFGQNFHFVSFAQIARFGGDGRRPLFHAEHFARRVDGGDLGVRSGIMYGGSRAVVERGGQLQGPAHVHRVVLGIVVDGKRLGIVLGGIVCDESSARRGIDIRNVRFHLMPRKFESFFNGDHRSHFVRTVQTKKIGFMIHIVEFTAYVLTNGIGDLDVLDLAFHVFCINFIFYVEIDQKSAPARVVIDIVYGQFGKFVGGRHRQFDGSRLSLVRASQGIIARFRQVVFARYHVFCDEERNDLAVRIGRFAAQFGKIERRRAGIHFQFARDSDGFHSARRLYLRESCALGAVLPGDIFLYFAVRRIRIARVDGERGTNGGFCIIVYANVNIVVQMYGIRRQNTAVWSNHGDM